MKRLSLSTRWRPKNSPCSEWRRPAKAQKARVHANRIKKMVLVFFDSKGVIYMNYVPKRKMVNTENIKKAVTRFLKIFRKKSQD
jgi:hypothetical protein